MSTSAQIGVTGLAVMGRNLARNFARNGYTVALHNRTVSRTHALVEEFGDEGDFIAAETAKEFVAALERPRRLVIMVKAGEPTDAVIQEFAPLLEPGDMIIDGGNAHFADTRRRERELREQGIHFVKMVHNGIEYADMQLIGEAYQLLRDVAGYEPAQIAEIFRTWNTGRLDSYLIEITAEVLSHVDAATGKPFVDVVQDQAEQKGTGRWTVQIALDLGVPVSGIAEAVFARALSGSPQLRAAARGLPGPQSGGLDHAARWES